MSLHISPGENLGIARLRHLNSADFQYVETGARHLAAELIGRLHISFCNTLLLKNIYPSLNGTVYLEWEGHVDRLLSVEINALSTTLYYEKDGKAELFIEDLSIWKLTREMSKLAKTFYS